MNRESIVSDEMRKQMEVVANRLMSEQCQQRHDPESVVNSAEFSANMVKNQHLWNLPPDVLVRCLLRKTRIHVLNRVGHEIAGKRDFRKEVSATADGRDFTDTGPSPGQVAEWKDLFESVKKKLVGDNDPDLAKVLDLLLEEKTRAEIADEMKLGRRKVERMVNKIGEYLRKEIT